MQCRRSRQADYSRMSCSPRPEGRALFVETPGRHIHTAPLKLAAATFAPPLNKTSYLCRRASKCTDVIYGLPLRFTRGEASHGSVQLCVQMDLPASRNQSELKTFFFKKKRKRPTMRNKEQRGVRVSFTPACKVLPAETRRGGHVQLLICIQHIHRTSLFPLTRIPGQNSETEQRKRPLTLQ